MLDFFSVQKGGCICKTCGKRINGLSDLGAIFVNNKDRAQTEVYCLADKPQGGGSDIGNLVSISVLPTTGVYETGVTSHPGEMPSVQPEFRIHMIANFDSGMSIPLNFNNTADKNAIDKLVGTVLRAYGKPYDITPTLPEVKYDTAGNFFYVDQEAHTKTETGADVVYQEKVELKFTDLINTPVAAEAKLLDGWSRVDELVDDDVASVLSVEGNYPSTLVTFDNKSPIATKVLPIDFKLDTSAIKAQAIDPTYTLKTYPPTHPIHPNEPYLEIYSHARLLYGTQVVVADFKNAVPVEYPIDADKIIDHVEFHATSVSLNENTGTKHDPDALYEVFASIDGNYYIYYENEPTPEVIPMNKPGQAAYTDPNNYEIADFYVTEIRHLRWTDAAFVNDELPTVVMDDPQPADPNVPNATLSGPSEFELDLKVKMSHYNDYDGAVLVDGECMSTNVLYRQDPFVIRVRIDGEERIAWHSHELYMATSEDRGDHIYVSFESYNHHFISDINGDDIAISGQYHDIMDLTNQGIAYDGGDITLTDGSTVQVGNVVTSKLVDFFGTIMNLIEAATFYNDYGMPIGQGMTVDPDSIQENSEDAENTKLSFRIYIPDPTYSEAYGDTNNKLFYKDFDLIRKKIDEVHDQLSFTMAKTGDHYNMEVTSKVEVFSDGSKDIRIETPAKTFTETLSHKVSNHTQPDGTQHSEPSLHTVLVNIINSIQDTEQYTSSLLDKNFKGISVDPTMYSKKPSASTSGNFNWVEVQSELIVPDPSWSRTDSSHAVANRNLLDKTNHTIKVLLPSRVIAKWGSVANPEDDKLEIVYDAKLDLSKNADAAWSSTDKTSQIDEDTMVLDSSAYPQFVAQLMALVQAHQGYHLEDSGDYAKFVDSDGNPMKGIQVATEGMNDTDNYMQIDATVIVPNPAYEGTVHESTVMANAIEVPVQVWVPKGSKPIRYIEYAGVSGGVDNVDYINMESTEPADRRMRAKSNFIYRVTYEDGTTEFVDGIPNDLIYPMPGKKGITKVMFLGPTEPNAVVYEGLDSDVPEARTARIVGGDAWRYRVFYEDGTDDTFESTSDIIWPMPKAGAVPVSVEFNGATNEDSIQYYNLDQPDAHNRIMTPGSAGHWQYKITMSDGSVKYVSGPQGEAIWYMPRTLIELQTVDNSSYDKTYYQYQADDPDNWRANYMRGPVDVQINGEYQTVDAMIRNIPPIGGGGSVSYIDQGWHTDEDYTYDNLGSDNPYERTMHGPLVAHMSDGTEVEVIATIKFMPPMDIQGQITGIQYLGPTDPDKVKYSDLDSSIPANRQMYMDD